ncbi:MAG: HAD family hydrolase [Bradymonadia bacterium]
MSIAFFDLDKTLLDVNSGSLWVKAELRGGHITRVQALKASWWLTKYHLGFADIEDAFREAIRSLEGVSVDALADRATDFYHREVAHRYRPGAREAVEAHRAAGDTLVLLTSSSPYLSRHVVEDLALDHALCNQFEIESGVHTGAPIEPLCYGPGKVDHALTYAEARGVALEQCTFYSDSASDAPMLEAVGRPMVVHPDPKLKRMARRKQWPIISWGTTSAAT